MPSPARDSTAPDLSGWASALGRVGFAMLFLWGGYEKLAYMDGNIGYMKAHGMPAPEFLVWPALLVEIVGGALILIGWKTQWAALALFAYTIPVTFIFHAYWSVPVDQALDQQVQFMKNLAILGGLLYVAAHGSGRFALDRSG